MCHACHACRRCARISKYFTKCRKLPSCGNGIPNHGSSALLEHRHFATVACWAFNQVGHQQEPCFFRFFAAGRLLLLLLLYSLTSLSVLLWPLPLCPLCPAQAWSRWSWRRWRRKSLKRWSRWWSNNFDEYKFRKILCLTIRYYLCLKNPLKKPEHVSGVDDESYDWKEDQVEFRPQNMSISARVYDVLGLVSPLIVIPRMTRVKKGILAVRRWTQSLGEGEHPTKLLCQWDEKRKGPITHLLRRRLWRIWSRSLPLNRK